MNEFFQGQDVADAGAAGDEVQGYGLTICRYCGALQDPYFPFCCELASLAPLAPTVPVKPLAVLPSATLQHLVERGSPPANGFALRFA